MDFELRPEFFQLLSEAALPAHKILQPQHLVLVPGFGAMRTIVQAIVLLLKRVLWRLRIVYFGPVQSIISQVITTQRIV